jgi:hypothetical protein
MHVVQLSSDLLRTTLTATAVLYFGLAGITPVSAAMNDLRVNQLESLELSERQAAFDWVVRELAVTLAAPPTHSVASLGMFEFELSTDHRITFVHDATGLGSSPWSTLTEDGEASAVQYVPRVVVRKGLPYSFEVGGNLGWLAASRQFVVGGYGRWAVLDGWTKVPDAAIQLSYDGYVGNDQLELGVFQLAVSIGYTFETRSALSSTGSRFSPFVGYGLLMAHAAPLSNTDGLGPVTAWANDAAAGVDPREFRFHRFFGGMQIRNGQMHFRIAADVNGPKDGPLIAGVNLSIGARF